MTRGPPAAAGRGLTAGCLALGVMLLAGCRFAPGPGEEPAFPVDVDPFATTHLQVGTFNLDWLTADLPGDFEPRNERDLAMIASLIEAMDVDVLAVQEVDGDAALAALDLDPVWAWDLGTTGWSQNQGLLWRTDRVTVTNAREVALPINDFPSKDPFVADVQALDGDLTFTAVAVHFNPYVEWSEARYRAEQVRDLVLWLDGQGSSDPPAHPVVVFGDMNDTLDGLNDEIDALEPLEELYRFATADTDDPTNIPFASQIDHVALDASLDDLRAGRGTPRGATVVHHDRTAPWSNYDGGLYNDQTISDHRPVYVDLALE